MSDVLSEHGAPLFPEYEPDDLTVLDITPSITLEKTKHLRMRLRITDYFYNTANRATWKRLETWATSLGFEVVRDHGAAQIGASCGIVAARVLTWLKSGQEDFMIQDTTSAASPAVLRQGNEVLCSTAMPVDEGFVLPHAGALIPTYLCPA